MGPERVALHIKDYWATNRPGRSLLAPRLSDIKDRGDNVRFIQVVRWWRAAFDSHKYLVKVLRSSYYQVAEVWAS